MLISKPVSNAAITTQLIFGLLVPHSFAPSNAAKDSHDSSFHLSSWDAPAVEMAGRNIDSGCRSKVSLEHREMQQIHSTSVDSRQIQSFGRALNAATMDENMVFLPGKAVWRRCLCSPCGSATRKWIGFC